MSRRSILATALAVILSLPVAVRAQETSSQPKSVDFLPKGSPAPAFALKDLAGNEVDIRRHLGKSPIVLSFWSIYCDSCVDEMIALQKLEDKYQGQGLVILAVNEDIRVTTDRVRRFLERLEKFRGKITYPIIFDQESQVFNSYRVTYLPTMILIDRDGRIEGYYRGFDPESEKQLLAEVEKLVTGAEAAVTVPPAGAPERIEVITVTGESALCGFFEGGKWRKSFTGNTDLAQEVQLTRDVARRDATRQSLQNALLSLGLELYANEPRRDCVDGSGIHLGRDPFDTRDPLSNLLQRLVFSDHFETVSEHEMLIDGVYYSNLTVRVLVDSLRRELESLGYHFEPLRITFTYVNMSPLDQKQFLSSLLNQSLFIGRYGDLLTTAHADSQVFDVYTSSQGFADAILKMDFGSLKVFVEDVTPASLELEVWK